MRAFIITAVAVCALTGCSGSTTAAPRASNSGGSTSTTVVADPAQYLLTLSDFPTGWSIDNSASSGNVSAPACLSQLKSSTESPKKAEASFAEGTLLPALKENIGSYAGKAEASAAFTRAAGILNGCKDVSFTSGGKKFTGDIGAMSFPALGEQSQAWSMKVSSSGVNAAFDVVLVAKGSMLAEVVLADIGTPSTDDLQSFTTAAVGKLP